MGRKSTKENKNIYQTSRENMNFTREAAAEQMGFISSDRIEKIEYEKTLPHPRKGASYRNHRGWRTDGRRTS